MQATVRHVLLPLTLAHSVPAGVSLTEKAREHGFLESEEHRAANGLSTGPTCPESLP